LDLWEKGCFEMPILGEIALFIDLFPCFSLPGVAYITVINDAGSFISPAYLSPQAYHLMHYCLQFVLVS
jgi:hypothetical protein